MYSNVLLTSNPTEAIPSQMADNNLMPLNTATTNQSLDSNNESISTDSLSLDLPKFIELSPKPNRIKISDHISVVNIRKYECEEKFISRCAICAELVISRKALISHTLTEHNTQLEPYYCDFCKAPYVKFETLKAHMSTKHLKPRKFQCTGCLKIFCQRYAVGKHVKRCLLTGNQETDAVNVNFENI